MNTITFTPSEKLDKVLTRKANESGLSQADLVVYILEHTDFDRVFCQSLVPQPAKTLEDLSESILAAISKNRERNVGKTFILNDILEFRKTPLTIRPALGKLLYQKMVQDPSAAAAPVIDRVESDGIVVYKKRQRALLYQYKSDLLATDKHRAEEACNPC